MTLDEIKHAIDNGRRVHWSNTGYVVIKGNLGQYLIEWNHTNPKHYIGLTWRDGVTLNGNESDFFIGDSK